VKGSNPSWTGENKIMALHLLRQVSAVVRRLSDDMISFIMSACNEERLLGRTLTALNAAARALGQPFEVVVVDDASTDRTASIAREQGARVIPVEHLQIAACSFSAVRPSAVRRSDAGRAAPTRGGNPRRSNCGSLPAGTNGNRCPSTLSPPARCPCGSSQPSFAPSRGWAGASSP
jgi:glycosyltransferase involved in cell wall biosynthesis